MTTPLVVSFGGGVNSAAMLVGMHERDIIPDLILFADTGDEKPETYAFNDAINDWCVSHSMPAVTRVSHPTDTLLRSCLRNGTLPSKAYGFPGCSVKFKHQPQESFVKKWQPAIDCWNHGELVVKAIGYDAGEERGSNITESKGYSYRYFLKEWGWDRGACVAALHRAGLPIPIKSACWHCPSSKIHEILWLHREHPDLAQSAIALEHATADYNKSVKGLGRNFSWEQVINAEDSQFKLLFTETVEIPCMCYDGESEAA